MILQNRLRWALRRNRLTTVASLPGTGATAAAVADRPRDPAMVKMVAELLIGRTARKTE
jgi:hypothetical protein